MTSASVSAALERAPTPKDVRLVEQFPLTVGTAMINDLSSRLEAECHCFMWTNRLGSVIGLLRLIKRLPETWVQTREGNIARALFHVIETHRKEMGRELIYHTANAFYTLVSTCYKLPSKQKTKEKMNLSQHGPKLSKMVGLALQALIKDKEPCRRIARGVLNQLAAIYNVSVGSLLCQFPAHLQRLKASLFARSIRNRPSASQVAVLGRFN